MGTAAPSSVASLFASRARVVGDAPAVVDARIAWSYRQLRDRASRLAGHLRGRGIGAGLPISNLRGISLISRSAGLVGHVLEEQLSPAMRDLWESAEAAVTYEEELP